jgi:hypothetical protein
LGGRTNIATPGQPRFFAGTQPQYRLGDKRVRLSSLPPCRSFIHAGLGGAL